MAKNDQQLHSTQWILLMATSVVSFMSTIDASIVNIAVPVMSRDLHAPMNQAEWVVSVYLVMICVLLIFFGKLSDQIGRVRLFQTGTLIFVAGSLFCGLSNSLPFLLMARLVQALGASMTMATNFGIITDIFPAHRRGIALGVNSAFVQLGSIAGPGLGGLILSAWGWHDIFFINVPIGLIAFVFGNRMFTKDAKHAARLQIDWPGYLTYAAAIIAFFVAVYWGQAIGFDQPAIWGLLLVTAALVAVFIAREKHTAAPLLDLRIFNQAGFTIGVVTTMLVFAIGYFNNMIMPFLLEETLGYASATAGLIMMAVPLVNVVAAPIGGAVSDHIGAEKVSLIALVLFLLPELIFVNVAPSWAIGWLILGLGLFGLANGTFQNNPMIMGNAAPAFQGIAGSIAALARNLGMSIGLSLATSLLYLGISQQAGKRVTTYPQAHPAWFVSGMHFAYRFALGIVVLSLVLLGGLVWRQRAKKDKV